MTVVMDKTNASYMDSNECCDVYSCDSAVHAGNLGSALSFRPRGSLARALYQKQQHDVFLSQFDKSEVSSFTSYFNNAVNTESDIQEEPLVCINNEIILLHQLLNKIAYYLYLRMLCHYLLIIIY